MERRLAIHIGNKLETLAARLAKTLDTPLPSPLDSEIVVVQSKGMERWLSMELARFHGVCANVTFPFPKTIVNQLFDALIPDLPEQSPYEPEIMTWKIMKLLPGLVGQKGFESLNNYLGPGGDMLKLYQLSDKIANVFDQYLVYRPRMLLEWERGKGKGGEWQAALWRKLVSDCGAPHSARLKDEFLAALKKAAEPPPDFPTRLSVFGISSLPPFHMEVLAGIAKFCEVNLFLMSPVRRSWSVKANSLVGSMGTLGREFFEQVGGFKAAVNEKFEEPAGDGLDSMLRLVQSDIYNNRERGGAAPAPAPSPTAAAAAAQQKTTIRKNDGSIQVHSCYSPMREIEVLHDNLLAMFDEDKNLEPGDVVVMTPEIETYAPFIHAVFDNPEDESARIRFSIADRSAAKESPLIDALLDIVSLHQSRLGAGRVVSILESRAVQQKFGLQDDDVDLVRRWVVSTAIRWGRDAESRRKLGLPPTPENTWKAGLDRLLLGYALPGKGSRMFEGILPYDDIEGGDALVLGNFMEFAQKLFAAVDDFGKTRTLGQWSELLAQTLESFFEPDEDSEREVRLVRRTIARLADIQDRSGFGEKVGIDAISSYLGSVLQRAQFGMGFLTGGVTFCAMLPMRSIPFKVVCLVGMNDAFYPRRPKALGFDLMARDPKPCDRSPRGDDRYLFLEALLSARRKLYISYTGRSIRDNTAIPPSVVVSELLDYLGQAFELEPDGKDKGPQKEKSAAGQIVTLHRLQAFSQGYFNNETGLFSYSRDNCDAARRAMAKRAGPATFIRAGAGLPPIGEEWKTLDVGRLGEFLVNPSRYLLQGRLGIRLDEGEAELDEREPFDVAGLEKYVLDKDLVEKRLAGQDMEEFMAVVRASGRLPHGNMGRCMYDSLVSGVDAFIEQLRPFIQDALLDPVNLDLRVADFRLTGRIDGIFEKGLVRFRYATVKTKDMLRMWVRHLALCALKPKKSPPTSLLVGSDAIYELRPVEDAANVLADLLEKYYEGMSAPLPFFPDSSWEFASAMLRGDPPDIALEAAADMWEGGFKRDGEGRDVYFDLCFGKVYPFDEAFEEAAIEIYEPLITSMEAIDR